MGQMYNPRGTERKLKPCVNNIAINLWKCDLLQQWNTEINIPPILTTIHKLTNVVEENIRWYYKEQ